MPQVNATVADLLRRYASVLSLEGANRFKLKAYRRAAETVEGMADDLGEFIRRGGDLQKLPGIGKAISEIIEEILSSGTLRRLDQTIAKLAPERAELAEHPRLDAAKVARIYKKLKINSIEELKQSLESGAIREQLGQRMEFHVRQGLDERPRRLLWSVRQFARTFEEHLESLPAVTTVLAVGSLRRKQETVGDLNFLVTGKSAASVFKQAAVFSGVLSTKTRDRTTRDFVLSSGLVVTLRFVPKRVWGLAAIVETGSAAHLDSLAAHATRNKIAFTAEALAKQKIDLSDERRLYRELGLRFIEPELREGRGEVQAAAENRLPKLIALSDLRGDLHMHTTSSDGTNTILEMARAALERGYQYIAITDHSQSLKITNGLTEKRLREHIRNIDKVNEQIDGIRILKSAEVDILEDGRLDYNNAILKELDFTICSIHSKFQLSKQQQTKRIMHAIDNPHFTILGHATGRLLLKREGYEIDMERILDQLRSAGRFVEINSSPDRLDLSAEHAHMAKERGIKIAINTDAHSIKELDYISAGIHQARRAWLEPSDVLNTLPLPELKKLLEF